MDNNHLFRKIRSLDHDMDRIFDITRKNANVFNQFSAESKRRISKLEKSNRKLGFVVFGLVLEDILFRYKIYQKISKMKNSEPEIEENEEN